MSLEFVLWFKIVFTALFWFLPLSLLPPAGFVRMGMPEPRPMLFVRLLAAAYFALVVGSWLGLSDLQHGGSALNTVWVGIVSNGLASLVLFYFGLSGAWRNWGRPAVIHLWVSAVVTALITLGLALCLKQTR